MLTILNDKYGEAGRMKDGTNGTQGQWFFLTALSASDCSPRWELVDSYADAQKAAAVLAPVHKRPFQKDLGDDDYETVYSEDNSNWDGKYPQFITDNDALIEDTKLDSRVDAVFTTADPGTAMVLTVSGYPTLDGASDDPGSSATPVATFVEWTGASVIYRTR